MSYCGDDAAQKSSLDRLHHCVNFSGNLRFSSTHGVNLGTNFFKGSRTEQGRRYEGGGAKGASRPPMQFWQFSYSPRTAEFFSRV